MHLKPKSEETPGKQVTFSDLISSNEMDDSEMGRHQNDIEPNWAHKSSTYTSQLDDPSSSYPYLPPVLEEPSSSYSEGEILVPLIAVILFFLTCRETWEM